MNRIKELREQEGLTQKELSENTNTPQNSLSQYESGKRKPKIETWQKMADYFGVSVPYLMGESVEEKNQKIVDSLHLFFDSLKKDDLEDAQKTLIDLENMSKNMSVRNFKRLFEMINSFSTTENLDGLSTDALKLLSELSSYFSRMVRDISKTVNTEISNRQRSDFEDLWKFVNLGDRNAIISSQDIEEDDKARILTFVRLALTFQNNLMGLSSKEQRDELTNEVIEKMEQIEAGHGLS